jgi:capsular polysaccharide biosynthesis protein
MNGIFAQYGALLVSRWRWIVLGILLTLAATTAVLVVKPPLYRSEAMVFVRTPGDISQTPDGGAAYAQAHADTYTALANSTALSSRVIADLGLDLSPEVMSQRIQATHPRGTAIIRISVGAPSAVEAERTASVLLDEYASTVRTLESVPGSLVPRAELVVVDPPGRAVRVVAPGVAVYIVLLGATLIGLVLGSLAAVLWSIFKHPGLDQDNAADTADSPKSGVRGWAFSGPAKGRNRRPRLPEQVSSAHGVEE